MGRRFFVQIQFFTSNFETALDDERIVGILHFLWCRFRPSLGMLSIVIFRNLYFFLFFQLNVLNANNAQTITLRIDGCSNLDCMTYNVARATSLFPPDG